MKFARYFLTVLLLALLAVSAMGLSVSTGSYIDPPGCLIPGEQVTAQYDIRYAMDSSSESMEFYSDFKDVSWVFTVHQGDREIATMPRSGRYEFLTGFELYYPGASATTLEIVFKGTVPDVVSVTNKTLFRIQHLDRDGETILDQIEVVQRAVNPDEVTAMFTRLENDLSHLNIAIAAAASKGAPVSDAQEKYLDAEELIWEAETLPPGEAYPVLEEAELVLNDGEILLEKALARRAIEEAESLIAAVNAILDSHAASGGGDEGTVILIEAKLDNAETLLILADDKFSSGQYPLAEEKAQAALEKAQDAHALALQLDAGTNAPEGTLPTLSTPSVTTSSADAPGSDDAESLKKDAGQVVLDIIALIINGIYGCLQSLFSL
jgi:tetratricopeptide (TPR) repeat protein